MSNEIKSPSPWLLALETRVIIELGMGLVSLPLASKQTREKKRIVMVIPGLGMGDFSTLLFRQRLQKAGYQAQGWGQGINMGTNAKVRDGLFSKVHEFAEKSGQSISIVGWSLGGIFARELGRKMPSQIHSIITLGSPFAGSPHGNRLLPIAQRLSGHPFTDKEMAAFTKRMTPPPVLTFAIHSKTDGIVNWRCSLEQDTILKTERSSVVTLV